MIPLRRMDSQHQELQPQYTTNTQESIHSSHSTSSSSPPRRYQFLSRTAKFVEEESTPDSFVKISSFPWRSVEDKSRKKTEDAVSSFKESSFEPFVPTPKYRPLRLLGRGEFGECYLVLAEEQDQQQQQLTVVKRIRNPLPFEILRVLPPSMMMPDQSSSCSSTSSYSTGSRCNDGNDLDTHASTVVVTEELRQSLCEIFALSTLRHHPFVVNYYHSWVTCSDDFTVESSTPTTAMNASSKTHATITQHARRKCIEEDTNQYQHQHQHQHHPCPEPRAGPAAASSSPLPLRLHIAMEFCPLGDLDKFLTDSRKCFRVFVQSGGWIRVGGGRGLEGAGAAGGRQTQTRWSDRRHSRCAVVSTRLSDGSGGIGAIDKNVNPGVIDSKRNPKLSRSHSCCFSGHGQFCLVNHRLSRRSLVRCRASPLLAAGRTTRDGEAENVKNNLKSELKGGGDDGGDKEEKVVDEVDDVLLNEPLLRRWAVQLLLGIQHMHSRRIVHRDIKLQNVFIHTNTDSSSFSDQDCDGGGNVKMTCGSGKNGDDSGCETKNQSGDEPTLKIGDFGLSRVIASTEGEGGGGGARRREQVGTPYYLSPEVAAGEPHGTKTDLWSLGVLLYYLVAQAWPFHPSGSPPPVTSAYTTYHRRRDAPKKTRKKKEHHATTKREEGMEEKENETQTQTKETDVKKGTQQAKKGTERYDDVQQAGGTTEEEGAYTTRYTYVYGAERKQRNKLNCVSKKDDDERIPINEQEEGENDGIQKHRAYGNVGKGERVEENAQRAGEGDITVMNLMSILAAIQNREPTPLPVATVVAQTIRSSSTPTKMGPVSVPTDNATSYPMSSREGHQHQDHDEGEEENQQQVVLRLVSREFEAFILLLLTKDQEARPSAEGLLTSVDWIRNIAADLTSSSSSVSMDGSAAAAGGGGGGRGDDEAVRATPSPSTSRRAVEEEVMNVGTKEVGKQQEEAALSPSSSSVVSPTSSLRLTVTMMSAGVVTGDGGDCGDDNMLLMNNTDLTNNLKYYDSRFDDVRSDRCCNSRRSISMVMGRSSTGIDVMPMDSGAVPTTETNQKANVTTAAKDHYHYYMRSNNEEEGGGRHGDRRVDDVPTLLLDATFRDTTTATATASTVDTTTETAVTATTRTLSLIDDDVGVVSLSSCDRQQTTLDPAIIGSSTIFNVSSQTGSGTGGSGSSTHSTGRRTTANFSSGYGSDDSSASAPPSIIVEECLVEDNLEIGGDGRHCCVGSGDADDDITGSAAATQEREEEVEGGGGLLSRTYCRTFDFASSSSFPSSTAADAAGADGVVHDVHEGNGNGVDDDDRDDDGADTSLSLALSSLLVTRKSDDHSIQQQHGHGHGRIPNNCCSSYSLLLSSAATTATTAVGTAATTGGLYPPPAPQEAYLVPPIPPGPPLPYQGQTHDHFRSNRSVVSTGTADASSSFSLSTSSSPPIPMQIPPPPPQLLRLSADFSHIPSITGYPPTAPTAVMSVERSSSGGTTASGATLAALTAVTATTGTNATYVTKKQRPYTNAAADFMTCHGHDDDRAAAVAAIGMRCTTQLQSTEVVQKDNDAAVASSSEAPLVAFASQPHSQSQQEGNIRFEEEVLSGGPAPATGNEAISSSSAPSTHATFTGSRTAFSLYDFDQNEQYLQNIAHILRL